MAEKEERIRIEQFEYEGFGHCAGFSTDGEGYYCEFAVGESIPITKEICENKCPYDSSISRQEAINRMAKALFKVDNVLALDIEFEQLTKQKQLTYKVFAEAALNALLEVK